MEMCFGAAWEVYVQGAFLAWERVLAHCRERGKTPVAARISPPAAFLPPKRSSVPSFRSPNAAPCRVIAAQTPPAAVFSQPKCSSVPCYCSPNAAGRRLFARFNVHKFFIWTTDDISLRYVLTCYNVFTYQNSGKNVSVGPRDMFATCCFFLTSTNMVQCNQSC